MIIRIARKGLLLCLSLALMLPAFALPVFASPAGNETGAGIDFKPVYFYLEYYDARSPVNPVYENLKFLYGATVTVSGDRTPVSEFLGWRYSGPAGDPNNGKLFRVNDTFKMPYGDVRLDAEWFPPPNPATYRVTFIRNYPEDRANAVHDIKDVKDGQSLGSSMASVPGSPAGYQFGEWRDDVGRIFTGSTAVTRNTTVYAQWHLRDWNVEFVDWDGRLIDEQLVEHGGNARTPSSPNRGGHRFTGWDGSWRNVTSNRTITAQYEPVSTSESEPPPPPPPESSPPPPPPSEPPPPPPTTNTTTPRADPDPGPQPPPSDPAPPPPAPEPPPEEPALEELDTIITEPLTPLEDIEVVQEPEIPRITIGGREILLFAPVGVSAWALLNLILAILGVILAAIVVTHAIIKKLRERKEVPEERQHEYESAQDSEETSLSRKYRLAWLATAILMGIIGAFLFILTQDITKMMVLLDMWTIAHAIIFLVEIITVMLIYRRLAVQFETNGAGKKYKIKAQYGSKLKPPSKPAKQGYVFAGWYTDDAFRIAWNFDDKVEKSLKLYAKWNKTLSKANKEPLPQ